MQSDELFPPEEERRRDFPTERRKGFKELAENIDTHAEALDRRLETFIKKATLGFAIVGVSSAVGLAGFGVVLHEFQQDNTNDCLKQNARHDDTSNQLIALAKVDEDARKTEAEKLEVRRRRDVTLALIDALAPKEKC